MIIYCDTSALMKRYAKESYSDFVNAIFADTTNDIFILEGLSELELRRNLAKTLEASEFEEATQNFYLDKKNGLATFLINRKIWGQAFDMVHHTSCGSLDLMHVSSAKLINPNIWFLTFDKRQAKAAVACGLRWLKPDGYDY